MTPDELQDDEFFDELVERVKRLTGLGSRAASIIAADIIRLNLGDIDARQIVEHAQQMGYEIETAEVPVKTAATFADEVSMDPAEVLTEVYMLSPRVLCEHMPKIGRAPEELQKLDPQLLEDLPEEIAVLLVKVDLFEGKATFWLRDEANDVDRPIGPIDLTRYPDHTAMIEAFKALLKRLPRVLAADYN